MFDKRDKVSAATLASLDHVGVFHELVEKEDAWVLVQKHLKSAIDVRVEKLSSHSTVLRALGGLGTELQKEHAATWKERLAKLETIDWCKKNKDWENICIVANSVVSNRQARAATKAYIKAKLDAPDSADVVPMKAA